METPTRVRGTLQLRTRVLSWIHLDRSSRGSMSNSKLRLSLALAYHEATSAAGSSEWLRGQAACHRSCATLQAPEGCAVAFRIELSKFLTFSHHGASV